MKFVCKTRVPFSQTGVSDGLSVIGAAQIIEDNVCAFFAAFGKDSVSLLKNYNSHWIFVKNRFEKRAPTVWNEEITVESYLTEKNAATVVVDTMVRNSENEIAVASRTEACVLDLAAQRVRRVSSVDFPDIETYKSEAGFGFTRFNAAAPEKAYSFTVPSTSIDFGRHLNNVEYLRFVLNAASVDKEIAFPVREAEINYLYQAREGDTLTLYSGEYCGAEFYEIKNGGQTVARCAISRGVPKDG